MLDPSENDQWLHSNARDMRFFDMLPKAARDAFNYCLTDCVNCEDALVAVYDGMPLKELLWHIRRNEMAAHMEKLQAGEIVGQSTDFVLKPNARHVKRRQLIEALRKQRKR